MAPHDLEKEIQKKQQQILEIGARMADLEATVRRAAEKKTEAQTAYDLTLERYVIGDASEQEVAAARESRDQIDRAAAAAEEELAAAGKVVPRLQSEISRLGSDLDRAIKRAVRIRMEALQEDIASRLSDVLLELAALGAGMGHEGNLAPLITHRLDRIDRAEIMRRLKEIRAEIIAED